MINRSRLTSDIGGDHSSADAVAVLRLWSQVTLHYTRQQDNLETWQRTMVIGANRAAIIHEIGVVEGVTAPVVVHAMRAREKFLR